MKTILIVEDVEDHLEIVKLILEQHSYSVISATNGKSGLEMADKMKPDLIILDVMLPEMNGFEVARAVRNNPAINTIPIIMLSVKTNQEDVEAGYRAGANEYISKPFSLEELVKKVKKHLGEEK